MPDGRPILAIETSNPSAWTPASPMRPGVVVGHHGPDGWRILSRRDTDPTRRHEDDLVPAIAAACGEAGMRARDLGGVAVSVGPGGYTAVRLAVTVARMICEVGGGLCIPVPTASAIARRMEPPGEPAAVALASKGPSTFITVFNVPEPPPPALREAADLDELHERGVRWLIVDRFAPPPVRERALALGWAISEPVFDPAAVLEASEGLAAVEPMALAPIYPREPEAVTKWRALHGGGPGGR